jgi:NitT/TauT family transport system permease protein
MSVHAAAGPGPGATLGQAPARPGGVRLRRWLELGWPPLIVFVLFVGGWALLSTTVYGDQNYLLPRPWSVVGSAFDNLGELWAATRITLGEAAAGFGAAIVVGMAVAILMSQAKWLERSLYPYAVMLQTVPVVAVAPVIVLWFGYNQGSVIVIAFMIAVFPIINNTLLGLLSTDRNHLDLFRLHRAGRLAQFRKLRLPNALPNVFAGLRVSAGLSVIGAIVGEFIIGSGGSEGGLGVKVIYAQSKLDTNLLFAEVFAATLLGFGFFVLVSYLGTLLLRSWHESALRADA